MQSDLDHGRHARKLPQKLQLGCGPGPMPADWINVDGSWSAILGKHPLLKAMSRRLHLLPASVLDADWSPDIIVHDLRRPLPFSNQSFAAVYGSHLLEHMYRTEAQRLLTECLRVLQPGGYLRMVVPDLKAMVDTYAADGKAGDGGMLRADALNAKLGFRDTAPPVGNTAYRMYAALNDFHSHKWMYDSQSLIFYFQSAGFVDCMEKGFLESGIEGIQVVEKADRLENGKGICVEGRRP
jgi:SAM-dependent methyltransferase